jgi:hypothetical protein
MAGSTLPPPWDEGMPGISMLAEKECYRRDGRELENLRRRQPRPADLARQTLHVEHRRSIDRDATAALRAPRAGRQLESIEESDGLPEPIESRQLAPSSSTCCHVKRNRMQKSAGATGSISAQEPVP